MKIQAGTGYALRILVYINRHGNRTVKSNELAEKLNISNLYMMKILSKLRSAGIIESIQGCNGGYRLAKSAGKISIFEVYHAVEGDIVLYHPQADVRYNESESAIKGYFDQIEDMLVLTMRRMTIRDLFEQNTQGRALCKAPFERIAE